MCVFVLLSASTIAQNDYQAEIGLSTGGSYYLGDANSKLFNNMQFVYGGLFRYNFNSRFALRAEFTRVTKIIGNNNSFSNDTINVGDICAEYNFFDLENLSNNKFSKPFSPFIFGGLGVMTDVYNKQKSPEPCISFGVGMKVKIAERWNLIGEWSNRLLMFSDNMENNPKFDNLNNLNGSNIFNNDLLSTLTVSLTYDFWKRPCKCLRNIH